MMKDAAQIVARRSAPGILVFNGKGDKLFSSPEASELFAARPSLEGEIRSLLYRLKKSSSGKSVLQLTASCGHGPAPHCVIRAFMVGEEDTTQKHIMVLVERIVERRGLDLERAKTEFKLSKRELEVLVPVHEGLSTRAISERLFISQQTVKDHIRNIMKKVGVNSRGAIIATLR